MLRVRAGLLYDEELEGTRIPAFVEELVSAPDFSIGRLKLSSFGDELPEDGLLSELKRSSVVFVVLGAKRCPQWLLKANLEEILPSSLVTVFIDEGNPEKDVVQRQGVCYRVLVYEMSRLANLSATTIELMRGVRRELLRSPNVYVPASERTTEEDAPYEVLSVVKKVVISPDGHGYIESRFHLRSTGGLDGTAHYFGLNEYTPPEITLPSIQELLNSPPHDRHSSRSFSYRLLHPADHSVMMTHVEAPESSSRNKVFRFLLDPRPIIGTELRFAWSWSHPDIFVPKGSDASSLKCTKDFAEVELIYEFEYGRRGRRVEFSENGHPTLSVYNPVGIRTAVLKGLETRLLHAVGYRWTIAHSPVNSTLVVHWETI